MSISAEFSLRNPAPSTCSMCSIKSILRCSSFCSSYTKKTPRKTSEPLISLVRQEGFEPPTHGLEGLPGYFYLFPSRAAPIKSRVPEPYNFIFSIKIHCFLGYSPPYGLPNHKDVATPKIMKLSIIPPASSSAHEAGIFCANLPLSVRPST